jgi:class 3 adenylate cyclase
MKSSHISYEFEKSRVRIDEILNTSDTSYEEVDEIPSRDILTFTNGYYINKTSALFVDIRNSSSLPTNYKRPVLARIYRSYISEVVAIINGNSNCAEINIVGDCVWGIFNSQYKYQIDSIFNTAAQVSSIIDVLNCKMKKRNIDPITIGIGIDFGRVLMIKAGYSGSGLNDVVWMGEVVNGASKLCSYGNKTINDYELMVANDFYSNLNEENKKLLTWNINKNCYHCNIINSNMNSWVETNCK